MTYQPSGSLQGFLPTTFILPSFEDEKEFNYVLTDFVKKIVASTNMKEIGSYTEEEIQNGQQFFNNQNAQRPHNIFRKVIDVGPLPNASTKLINHEIDVSSTTRFTRIYGAANDPGNTYIPLPYASPTALLAIELSVDNQAVSITTGIDYTSFTDCFVVLEYYRA